MKKNIIQAILILCSLNFCGLNAQVGIGTLTPDSSAVLELFSTDRGFLISRVTTIQRDVILLPATGLQIYNLSVNDIQVNTGTPLNPVWTGVKGGADAPILFVTFDGDISTTSINYDLIPGMTISPPPGTYLVLFNGQYGLTASEPISTQQGVIDLLAAYDQLMAIAATTSTHGAIFGNGEILLPGIYDVSGAVSLAATLMLDGIGDTNSIFIIRSFGALTTGAGTTVELINGAKAKNIFWISEGALSLAANTIMKGTLLVHNAAVSAAAGSNLEGRMFSTTGAIAFGPGTAYLPAGNSFINLGVLTSFVMFTATGALANTGPSNITGDVGTNAGAIAGFEDLNGTIYGPGQAPNPVNNSLVSFSIYQNGTLIPFSSRTSDINTSVITLQAMATVSLGQSIDVRWKVDTGGVVLGNRILSIVNGN